MAELQLNGLDTNFRLFDVTVKSVLGYGAEVWAPELLCNDPLSNYNDLSSHFEQLLGAEAPDLPVPPVVPGTVPPVESIKGLLQTSFSMEKLTVALKKVRNGAAMLVFHKPQLLKATVAELGPALLELLNASVAVGKLPTVWALSAITAIPKTGSDTRAYDGYRGVAVGTLAAKLHGSMLDIRVSGWAEEAELRAEDDWDAELKAASEAPDDESDKFDFPNLAGEDLRSLISGIQQTTVYREEKAAVMYIDGETMEVVEQFKYLGTIFHCSQSLSQHAIPARALSGRKSYHTTRRRMEELELTGLEINFRLFEFVFLHGLVFDVMVDPALAYGAEVWAPELLCQDPLKNSCERVHLQALKWLFGLPKSTASCIVLSEAGRWPLALRWVKRLARFYNGLVKAPSNSSLKNDFIDKCQLKANPLPGSIPSAAQRCWAAQLQRAFSLFGVVISFEEHCELNVNQVCRR
ncbi:hypothetical protein KSW81_002321 [Nannochloris sp. 'desiccata']|nr:hypothetical protein KSW81_002321 [Chlorella desiccata (nom. nud.)]